MDAPMDVPRTFFDRFHVTTQFARRPGSFILFATDSAQPGREVVLKVYRDRPRADSPWISKFEQVTARLLTAAHPALVPVLAGGEEQGLLFLALEKLGGSSLREVLSDAQGPLPLENAVTTTLRLCGAVSELHRLKLIHGHIDSRGVLFDGGEAYLGGYFPAAIKEIQKENGSSERLIVEPAYIAPEQVAGEPLSNRTDIYALGVLCYEMVSGRRPFIGKNPLHLALVRLTEDPAVLGPDIPPGVAEVIFKALARNPEERYSSAAEFAEALGKASARFTRSSSSADGLSGQVELTKTIRLPTLALPESPDLEETLLMSAEELSEAPQTKSFKRYFHGLAKAFSVAMFLILTVAFGIYLANRPRNDDSATDLRVAQELELRRELEREAALLKSNIARPSEAEEEDGAQHANRRREFQRAMLSAEAYIASGNLVEPEKGNAYDSLQEALRIDPGNKEALDLLYSLAAEAIERGDEARERDRLEEMQRSFRTAQALGVDPDFLSARAGKRAEGAAPRPVRKDYLDAKRLEIILEKRAKEREGAER